MKQEPLVSVIINCYNSARYLRAALDSVRAQTFADWEIVFWDNQSTDDSAAIFKSVDDPRFCYFLAPEHTILGKAKGLAIENAHGQWLAFLDCDDFWRPNKLERQLAIASEEGPELGLVYGRMDILVEEEALTTPLGRSALAASSSGRPKPLPEGYILADLLQENPIPQPSAMVRRSAYWSVGGINPELKHAWDFDLFVQLSNKFKVRAVQDIVCTYRVHGSNLSHTQVQDACREGIAIVGRYLPASEAKLGIRRYQTSLAANDIGHGRVLEGMRRLVIHGDILLFAYKTTISICRGIVRGVSPRLPR